MNKKEFEKKFELDLLIHELGYKLGNEVISYTKSGNPKRLDNIWLFYETYKVSLEIWFRRNGSPWVEKIKGNPTRKRLLEWYSEAGEGEKNE